MGRDLAAARFVWDDVCTDVLPLDQFVSFVLYAPPGTAVFHVVNDGWEATTHKVSDLISWVKMLISINTRDPKGTFEKLGVDQRPGMESAAPQEKQMTIGDYMKLAGLKDGEVT